MDYQSRIADDLGNDGPTVLFGSLCLIGFDTSIVVSLQSSSCLTPGPVSPGLFLPRSRPWLLSTAAERWFGARSCKPVPRGPPSSVKQLRTTWPLGLSHSWHTMFMASGSGECSKLTINIGRKPVKGREGKIHGTDNCFS